MEVRLTIPEFTVKDYNRFKDFVEALSEKDLTKIVDVLSNWYDGKVLLEMSVSDLYKLSEEILEEHKPDHKTTIKHKGRTYKMITKYTVGWYADYDAILHTFKGEIPAEHMMALNYIPKGLKWSQIDFGEHLKEVSDMPLKYYLGLLAFFLNVQKVIVMMTDEIVKKDGWSIEMFLSGGYQR